MRNAILSLLLAVAASAVSAQQPTNCHATSRPELFICANAELLELHREMHRLAERLKSVLPRAERELVTSRQAEATSDRDRACRLNEPMQTERDAAVSRGCATLIMRAQIATLRDRLVTVQQAPAAQDKTGAGAARATAPTLTPSARSASRQPAGICNETPLRVWVAVGQIREGGQRRSRGWWQIDAGDCFALEAAAPRTEMFYHARSETLTSRQQIAWGTGRSFCVDTSGPFETGDQCPTGERMVEFSPAAAVGTTSIRCDAACWRAHGVDPSAPHKSLSAADAAAPPPEAPAVSQRDQNAAWCSNRRAAAPDLMISACSSLIQSGAESGRALAGHFLNRGVAWAEKGEYQRAVSDYTQAIQLDPNSGRALRNRAAMHIALGDHDAARRDQERARHVIPATIPEYLDRAYARQRAGDRQGADADFRQAAALPANTAWDHWERGAALEALVREDEALAAYSAAIGLEPHEAQYYEARAGSHFWRRDWNAALRDYNEAIKRDPKSAAFVSGRAWTLLRLGRRAEALREMEKAARMQPDALAYVTSRAAMLAETGDFARAENLCRQAAAHRAATSTIGPGCLLNVSLRRRDYASAERHAQTLLDRSFDKSGPLLLRGQARLGLRQVQAALRDFGEARGLARTRWTDAWIDHSVGVAYRRSENPASAEAAFAAARRNDPRIAERYRESAYIQP